MWNCILKSIQGFLVGSIKNKKVYFQKCHNEQVGLPGLQNNGKHLIINLFFPPFPKNIKSTKRTNETTQKHTLSALLGERKLYHLQINCE